MDTDHQKKHIFLAIAVVTAIFSPILYFFVPQTIGDIVHHKEGVWFVSVPQENFTTFAVGYGFIFLASFIIFLLDIRKLSIVLGVVFVFCAFGTFYIASQSHVALSNETISFSPLFQFEEITYTWEEVDRVIHHRTESGDISNYEFIFNDGNNIMIKDTAYFQDQSYRFHKKLAEVKLSVDFSLIEESK